MLRFILHPDGVYVQKPVVLVIDDEDMNREVCRDALELDGYEVLTATGTRQAVELLSTRSVDAIVCDMHMPHNGVRLFEHLLKKFPELAGRFLFVTGDPSQARALDHLAAQAPCLFRPFPIRMLLDAVRSALA